MATSTTSMLPIARALVAAGISVIPIRKDGSKRPALQEWKPYQTRRPAVKELERWFLNGSGLAIVNGAVSGNLETLDIDAPELYDAWAAEVERVMPGLLARLPEAETPSGGRQLYYHCDEAPIPGNLKLAQRPPTEAELAASPGLVAVTLFETRGEGGYAIIPPTPAYCHPDKRPYKMLRGDVTEAPTITALERDVLHDSARAFNTYVNSNRVVSGNRTPIAVIDGERPGDAYNREGDWNGLLRRHGWRSLGERGGIGLWQRPGKHEFGISATTNYADSGLLYVFSSNAAPFEHEHAYSLFAAYTLLEHHGDYRAAASALAARGYGARSHVGVIERQGTTPSPAAPLAGVPARFALYTLQRLGALPPDTWLIPQRIIGNGLTLLYGPSSTGKSFLMLHYCMLIAERFPNQTVVYIAPEGGRGYWKRAQAWANHYKRELPRNLVFLLDAPRLDDSEDRVLLIDTLQAHKPVLVVIDTLARCAIGLDENSARDMGLFIHGTDQIRAALGCGVTLVHHTGKSGAGYRGSSALIAAADVALELIPDADVIRLECAKIKDERTFEPETYRLLPVSEFDSCVLVPATTRTDRATTLHRYERKVLDCLALAVFREHGAKTTQIRDVTGIPEGTLYRILSGLKDRDFISQATKGDPYYITAAGDAQLSNPAPQQDAQLSELSINSQQLSDSGDNSQLSLSSLSPPFRGDSDDSESESPSPPDESSQVLTDFWSKVPPSRRTFLRMYLRGNKDSDQDRARELCEEYGLDYEAARAEANRS